MDGYSHQFTEVSNTTYEIYIKRKDGNEIPLEGFEYSLVKEEPPLLTMGTPMPSAFDRTGRRHLSGHFEINFEHLGAMKTELTMYGYLRIEVKRPEFDAAIVFENLDIIHMEQNNTTRSSSCTFIKIQDAVEVVQKMENLTKRQLAKRLLSKEY